MPDHNQLVIRRVKKVKKGGHHGGAWKIALADFALAMMALFLVLWIINVASPEELAVIEGYFNDPMGPGTAGYSASPIDLGGSPAKSLERKLQTELPEPGSTPEVTEEILLGTGNDGEKMKKLNDVLDEVFRKSELISNIKDNLRIEITPEGVRVTLLDDPRNPMFERGSDRMIPDIENTLLSMAKVFSGIENPIAISGHTDAAPYAGPQGQGNWELSSMRANAARRILEEGGVSNHRFAQVIGLADTIPYDKFNPSAAQNRRITITVLSDKAYQEMLDRNRKRYGTSADRRPLDLEPEDVF